MIQAHPWMGLGWDGYRDNCMQPQHLKGVSWLPVSHPASEIGCTIHPHNDWLLVATNCGLPGTLLFAVSAESGCGGSGVGQAPWRMSGARRCWWPCS